MMGCGKTTVSEELARLTGMARTDTDEEIVKKHGRIADIFEKYGEGYFRELERAAVRDISARDNTVIATGGGCVLFEENVNVFRKSGKIIFLRTSPETLVMRLEGDTERPLLAGGAQKRIAELLPARTPKYVAAADFIVDTDGLTPREIALEIAELCGVKVVC